MGITACVAAGATLVGGGISAYGSYQSGQAAKATGNFNARVGELQAQDSIQRGEFDVRQQRMATRSLIGAQRAAYGAQGVELDEGSALQVQRDSAGFGELDALMVRNNAAREAWGHRVDAINSRMAGKYAARAANTQAISTLATSGADAFSAYRSAGGWSGGGGEKTYQQKADAAQKDRYFRGYGGNH